MSYQMADRKPEIWPDYPYLAGNQIRNLFFAFFAFFLTGPSVVLNDYMVGIRTFVNRIQSQDPDLGTKKLYLLYFILNYNYIYV